MTERTAQKQTNLNLMWGCRQPTPNQKNSDKEQNRSCFCQKVWFSSPEGSYFREPIEFERLRKADTLNWCHGWSPVAQMGSLHSSCTLTMSVSVDHDVRGDAVCTDWGADNKTDSATDGCGTERPVEDFDWPAWPLPPQPFTIGRDRLPENWGVGNNLIKKFPQTNSWVRTSWNTIKTPGLVSICLRNHYWTSSFWMKPPMHPKQLFCVWLEQMFDKQTKSWSGGWYMYCILIDCEDIWEEKCENIWGGKYEGHLIWCEDIWRLFWCEDENWNSMKRCLLFPITVCRQPGEICGRLYPRKHQIRITFTIMMLKPTTNLKKLSEKLLM